MNKKGQIQKATQPKRMRRPKGPMSSVSSGQSAVRPDPRAALMNTPERLLHDYVAEVSERTEVRKGIPLPMGTHEYGGESTSPSSAVTPAAFGWSCLINP